MRGRPSIYRHLLRAMRAGDTLFLDLRSPRMDKQIHAVAAHDGGKFSTTNFLCIGVGSGNAPDVLRRVVRVECLKPVDTLPSKE